MKGEFIGIFGQSQVFSSRKICLYPHDVKALMDQKNLSEKQAASVFDKKRISIKKDVLPKIDASIESCDLSPSLNTWYSKSIYAKEVLLKRAYKRNLAPKRDRGSIRYYHNLESFELETVKIPKMKLDFTGL
jgi:hypothetical protein